MSTIRLDIFTVYPAAQNLILPLIWFHSVHLWPRTNLGKLAFETTLVLQKLKGLGKFVKKCNENFDENIRKT